MSDDTIALLACPVDPGDPESAFDWLPDHVGANVRRFLAVTTKTKAPKGVEILNLTANYPAELARIESLAAIVRAGDRDLAQASDSYSLYALQRLIWANPDIAMVAMVRSQMAADPGAVLVAFSDQQEPFSPMAQDPAIILFDRRKKGADLALSLALDTALSGAIYAQTGYMLSTLLNEAQQVARSELMDGWSSTVPSALNCDIFEEALLDQN
jgi:hypothetical protein